MELTNIWVTADTHYGQKSLLRFTDDKGELIRGKIFKTIEEHDETLVDNWNKLVRPHDHVYHLGDVVMNKHFLPIVKRLNGHKRLVMGNHDIFDTELYLECGFEKVCGVRVWPKHGLIFSHIPLHPESLKGRGWKNIHGHTHHNKMEDTELYQCVSVEQTDYKPVLIMR